MRDAILWFEIPTSDIDRATAFYEVMLGATLSRETVAGVPHAIFPVDRVDMGVTGALVARAPTRPGALGTVIYLACEDVDTALDRAVAAGGKVVMGATVLPNIGTIAAIADVDENVVGLHAIERSPLIAHRDQSDEPRESV